MKKLNSVLGFILFVAVTANAQSQVQALDNKIQSATLNTNTQTQTTTNPSTENSKSNCNPSQCKKGGSCCQGMKTHTVKDDASGVKTSTDNKGTNTQSQKMSPEIQTTSPNTLQTTAESPTPK